MCHRQCGSRRRSSRAVRRRSCTSRRRSYVSRKRGVGQDRGQRRHGCFSPCTAKRGACSTSRSESSLRSVVSELKPGTRWQVFCDLDGVLADFDRGVVERTGVKPTDFRRRRKMWRRLAPPCTQDFFSTLPWMDDGEQLWTFLAPLSPAILSGSPSGDWAAPQKRRWCAEQLRLPDERVLIVDPCDKALFSHPGAVLIDDWVEHREPWEARGGIFIHYTSASRSIALVEVALRKLGFCGALPPLWPQSASNLHKRGAPVTEESSLQAQHHHPDSEFLPM